MGATARADTAGIATRLLPGFLQANHAVSFDNVAVAEADIVRGGDRSFDDALATARVVTAAYQVGGMLEMLDMSVAHSNTRIQFGTPIGAFQGIKHALADNYVGLERARSLTYAAAARLGDAHPDTGGTWTAAALAKAAAGDAASNCARTAVQVHGALAQTWEHDIHLYVRHAWQGAAMLGDSRALFGEIGRRFAEGFGGFGA